MSEVCRARCPLLKNVFAMGEQLDSIDSSLAEMRLEIIAALALVEEAAADHPGNPATLRQMEKLRNLAAHVTSDMDRQDLTREQHEAINTDNMMASCETGPTTSLLEDVCIVYCGSRAASDVMKISYSTS